MTLIWPLPSLARSAAVTTIVNWVAETNVVARGELFHWPTETPLMKCVPVTVTVKSPLLAVALLGATLVTVGAVYWP